MKYTVEVMATIFTDVCVEADNEKQAAKLAEQQIGNLTHKYIAVNDEEGTSVKVYTTDEVRVNRVELLPRYYSILRPVGIGTYPKGNVVAIKNFDEPTYVEAIGRTAWGYIDYTEPISEDAAKAYEFVKAE